MNPATDTTPPATDPSTLEAALRGLLHQADPEAAALLDQETTRQQDGLTLIASENHSSQAVRAACASQLTDKYAEGYPGARYYGGCEIADTVEELAQKRALELFRHDGHANVQPHSGTTANFAVLKALAKPGGRIVGMSLADGGHLSHGFQASHTGQFFDAKQYGVNDEGLLDYDAVRDLMKEHRPAVLVAGGSAYAREIDYKLMAEIAHEHDALLLADIAHPAGLIAAGVMASPLPHADVVTMTTHKTLRGARGGMILCTDELAKPINSSVFPGGQGGPLMHQIAGKAVAFGEALQPEFREYQTKVKENARVLAEALQEQGLAVVTGGTDNHIVLVDLRSTDATGSDVEDRCKDAGIYVNKNMVPGDPRSPRVTSGLRVGTAAVTTRGLGAAEIRALAGILVAIVKGEDPSGFQGRVRELCSNHPLP